MQVKITEVSFRLIIWWVLSLPSKELSGITERGNKCVICD